MTLMHQIQNEFAVFLAMKNYTKSLNKTRDYLPKMPLNHYKLHTRKYSLWFLAIQLS